MFPHLRSNECTAKYSCAEVAAKYNLLDGKTSMRILDLRENQRRVRRHAGTEIVSRMVCVGIWKPFICNEIHILLRWQPCMIYDSRLCRFPLTRSV